MYVFLDQEGGCGRQKTPLSSLLKKKKTPSPLTTHIHPQYLTPQLAVRGKKDGENDPSSKSYSVRTTHGVVGNGIKMKERGKKKDEGTKNYLENRPKSQTVNLVGFVVLGFP